MSSRNYSCAAFSLRRYKNWSNWFVMTCLMKVFQIQRVVPYLVNCAARKLGFTNLKFENEYNVINNRDHVDSLAQPQNRVLKVDFSTPPVWG